MVESFGFFKNRTEIPRRSTPAEAAGPCSRNDKIFAYIPYAGGAQLGHLVCVHCGEKILGSDSRRWADVPLRHFIPQNDNPRFTIYGSCSSRLLKPCFCLYFAPYPTPTACRPGQSEACRHSPDKVPRCCNEGGALTRGVIQRGALSVVQIFLGLCLGLPKK